MVNFVFTVYCLCMHTRYLPRDLLESCIIPTHPFLVRRSSAQLRNRGEVQVWRYNGPIINVYLPLNAFVIKSARFSKPGWYSNLIFFGVWWSRSQKYLISMARERCRLIILLTIPVVVVLSIWIGVGRCGWPYSLRVRRRILAPFELITRAPSSASAAKALTNRRIEHVT